MNICVCLGAEWDSHWPVYKQKADLIELRVDLMFPALVSSGDLLALLSPLFANHSRKIILTCRLGVISPAERLSLFTSLLPLSPAYLDLEYDSPPSEWELLSALAQQHQTKIIASFHHDKETPCSEELRAIIQQSFSRAADLVKIVCRCRDAVDEARLMSLYKTPLYAGRLIAFGMGPYALTSRLHAAALGAPILYAAPDQGAPTAPGQPGFSQLKEHLLNIECRF